MGHFGWVDQAWLGDAVKVLSWLGAPPSVVEEATTIASSTLSGVERLMQHFHKQVGGVLRSSLGTHSAHTIDSCTAVTSPWFSSVAQGSIDCFLSTNQEASRQR